MIVSASRRTDIPAYFSQWFMNRIREGFVQVTNPFNPSQLRTCSLHPEDVEAIVFWSKDPSPLIGYLDELDSRGYRYYFQLTLNDYPPVLEPRVPPIDHRLRTLKTLSDRLGPKKVVWRYDPIVVSTATPVEYHIQSLERMARALSGHSERLVISFLDSYWKVSGRLSKMTRDQGICFTDLTLPEHREELLELAKSIHSIGTRYGFQVVTCAEAVDLSSVGIEHGACIDGPLLSRLFGIERPMQKDKGQRAGCRCVESVDIGAYNTCSHHCAYCYANFGEASIRAKLARHSDSSPSLISAGFRSPCVETGRDS